MKFVEAFCTAIGAVTLIVFGSAILTNSNFNFSPLVLVIVLAVCGGYAAHRAGEEKKRRMLETGHRPARNALIAFLIFLGCGIALIATSKDQNIRYSQSTIVFDRSAADQAELFKDFLALHDYLTRSGFVPAAEPPSPFGFKSGLVTQEMVSFCYVRQPEARGFLRIRVDVHPKEQHLTCYAEPSAARHAAYDEAIKRSEEFSRNLRASEARLFERRI